MSEPKPIKFVDLARHWGCSRAYVRKLVIGKGLPVNPAGMPAFTSLEAADAWRIEHAPGRKAYDTSAKKEADAAEKTARFSDTTTAAGTTTEGRAPAQPTGNGAEFIDVEKFIRRDRDFDSLMVEQAERVPQIAFGLLELKQRTGVASTIAAATDNWQQAAKAAAAIRTQFLDVQERTRALIQLDQVMDVVGTELQALRTNLLKLGERAGPKANPENPALAQAAIDAAVDLVFRQTTLVLERTRKELGVS